VLSIIHSMTEMAKSIDDDGNVISTHYLASLDWGKPIAADQQMAPIASAEDGWVLYQGTIGLSKNSSSKTRKK